MRGAGGVSAEIEDQAGTIYAVDPEIAEPADGDEPGAAVRANGRVVARPTAPPFRLWDRSSTPPEADRLTDRPYCTLRWHAPTHSFYAGTRSSATTSRPAATIRTTTRATVRLAALERDPEAGPPPSERVLGSRLALAGLGEHELYGHSALAARDGWLYIGYRASSVIVRLRLAPDGRLVEPVAGELLARVDPYDPRTLESANLTDLDFDAAGRLYVISAEPGRIHRFVPDPRRVHDGRTGPSPPWLDLAAALGKPKLKIENLLGDGDRLFIGAGDGYSYQQGALGTVYRVALED